MRVDTQASNFPNLIRQYRAGHTLRRRRTNFHHHGVIEKRKGLCIHNEGNGTKVSITGPSPFLFDFVGGVGALQNCIGSGATATLWTFQDAYLQNHIFYSALSKALHSGKMGTHEHEDSATTELLNVFERFKSHAPKSPHNLISGAN